MAAAHVKAEALDVRAWRARKRPKLGHAADPQLDNVLRLAALAAARHPQLGRPFQQHLGVQPSAPHVLHAHAVQLSPTVANDHVHLREGGCVLV